MYRWKEKSKKEIVSFVIWNEKGYYKVFNSESAASNRMLEEYF